MKMAVPPAALAGSSSAWMCARQDKQYGAAASIPVAVSRLQLPRPSVWQERRAPANLYSRLGQEWAAVSVHCAGASPGSIRPTGLAFAADCRILLPHVGSRSPQMYLVQMSARTIAHLHADPNPGRRWQSRTGAAHRRRRRSCLQFCHSETRTCAGARPRPQLSKQNSEDPHALAAVFKCVFMQKRASAPGAGPRFRLPTAEQNSENNPHRLSKLYTATSS